MAPEYSASPSHSGFLPSCSPTASSNARDTTEQQYDSESCSRQDGDENQFNYAVRWSRSQASEDSDCKSSSTTAEDDIHTGNPDRKPLLNHQVHSYRSIEESAGTRQTWESARSTEKIGTTWQTEAKVLGTYSCSLAVTFLLQHSLTVASVFTIGHIGTVELGAVSLASMTANITGYAVYQGLATSLDTLAAQAYGSGEKKLVGLQTQRMLFFLWAISIPIAAVWFCGTSILEAIIPEQETARLAGLYLKLLIPGVPGYAAFESGKRFVQAQGLFSATLYCTLVCAPLNALMNYVFVWELGWGFIGAPIAVSITQTLLPLFLFCYVYFIDGLECWGGFTSRAFCNWWPMIQLAIPGLITMLAEFLAFEILTLAASRLGTTALAGQSVLATVTAITFQIPFSVGISASTRIANLIGAALPETARKAAKVDLIAATAIGVLNAILLVSLRDFIPRLFTQDPAVTSAVANALPYCAAMQLFDSLVTNANGILRGIGRQEIGGYVGLLAFYVIGLPVSFYTAFGLSWGLSGLWTGPTVGLGVVALVEGLFIYQANWERAVEDAKWRNAQR